MSLSLSLYIYAEYNALTKYNNVSPITSVLNVETTVVEKDGCRTQKSHKIESTEYNSSNTELGCLLFLFLLSLSKPLV